LPTRSAGLLPARLPGSVRTAPRTAQTLLLTASRKRPIADRAAIGSPVSIINGEKSTHKITHRNTRCYSISIIPIRITATAAPAASFLPPNRKRLGLNSEAYSKLVAEASPMLANGDSTLTQNPALRAIEIPGRMNWLRRESDTGEHACSVVRCPGGGIRVFRRRLLPARCGREKLGSPLGRISRRDCDRCGKRHHPLSKALITGSRALRSIEWLWLAAPRALAESLN
jgi:hypothetical protein